MPHAARATRPDQTLCIFAVPLRKTELVSDAARRLTSVAGAINAIHDKGDAARRVLYINYDSPRRAAEALDAMAAWVGRNFQDPAVRVALKSRLAVATFALSVAGAPDGTPRADVAAAFARFGAQSAVMRAEGAGFYVHFPSYDAAAAALADAQHGRVVCGGRALRAYCARNTRFVANVLADARFRRQWSYTLDELRAIAADMTDDRTDPAGVAEVLAGAGSLFVPDDLAGCYHIIDEGNTGVEDPAPPRCDSEPRHIRRARAEAVRTGLADALEDLVALFKALWQQAHGAAWDDTALAASARSNAQLLRELPGGKDEDRALLRPTARWDLSLATQAFLASSVQTAMDAAFGAVPRAADVSADLSALRVLVDDDLVDFRYVCVLLSLPGSRHHAPLALTALNLATAGTSATCLDPRASAPRRTRRSPCRRSATCATLCSTSVATRASRARRARACRAWWTTPRAPCAARCGCWRGARGGPARTRRPRPTLSARPRSRRSARLLCGSCWTTRACRASRWR